MIRDLDDFCCAAAVASENECAGGILQSGGAKLSKPSRKQIKAAAQRAFDQLWYAGHVELGRPEAGEKSAIEIEMKYAKQTLQRCEACVLRLEGRLESVKMGRIRCTDRQLRYIDGHLVNGQRRRPVPQQTPKGCDSLQRDLSSTKVESSGGSNRCLDCHLMSRSSLFQLTFNAPRSRIRTASEQPKAPASSNCR
jgi:hypothetical protein